MRVHGERRRGQRRVQQRGGGVQVVLRVDAGEVRRRVLLSVPIERVVVVAVVDVDVVDVVVVVSRSGRTSRTTRRSLGARASRARLPAAPP